MIIKIRFTVITMIAGSAVYAQSEINLNSESLRNVWVLSGGGAKGMAHVEARYSLSYPTNEMEESRLQRDGDQIPTDAISLRNILIEEKPYYRRYLVVLPVDGYQVGLPDGAIQGQQLSGLVCLIMLWPGSQLPALAGYGTPDTGSAA